MTIPSQQGIVIPAIADAGTVSIAANVKTVTGDATTLAAITRGCAFLLPGISDIEIAATAPINLGGGVSSFDMLNTWGSTPYSGKAWALADLPNDDEAAIILQQDDIGNTAGRASHNSAANGYCYLDATTSIMWERNGPSGTWTNRCTTAVLWVSTVGSDTDPTNPERLTIQAAIDELAISGDLSGWNVIIGLKAGTYGPFVLKEIAGAPSLLKICGEASLTGTPGSLTSYIVSSTSPIAAVQATNLKDAWMMEGFTLTSTKGHLLQAKGARLRFNQLRFGAAAGAHMAALAAGSIVMAGNGYEIAGGGSAHMLANGSGGTIDLQAEATVPAPTINIAGTGYVFKTAFAWARASGHIFTGTGLVFTGSAKTSVSARRWRAEQNSSIDTGQSGEKYLPGTALAAGNGVAVKNGEYI